VNTQCVTTEYRLLTQLTYLCELVWIWCELEYSRIAPTQSYRVALTI